MVEKPSLNQISSLLDILRDDEHIIMHWDIKNERVFNILSNITLKQYKFILHLLFSHKYIKLNKMFESINLPRI